MSIVRVNPSEYKALVLKGSGNLRQIARETQDEQVQYALARVLVREGDREEAEYWMTKAAERGLVEAKSGVAALRFAVADRHDGTVDYSLAVKYATEAMEAGDADAAINLGTATAFGLGIEENFDRALELYHHAKTLADDENKFLQIDRHIEKLYLRSFEKNHLRGQCAHAKCKDPEAIHPRLIPCQGCFTIGYCSEECASDDMLNHLEACREHAKQHQEKLDQRMRTAMKIRVTKDEQQEQKQPKE